ncbi:hypothetical protein D7V67_00620 [Clostridium paraputrificum]|uniref:hypothetical protein n=1 Tax=Clostridium paraputrificum TaxID=29363 RepID=UPI000EA11439|nr:hypothetical protein [Clostridium paraputrificum]RKI50460.1 hypothetical protein D7V67_00620 [Clostridium paraputrificum]
MNLKNISKENKVYLVIFVAGIMSLFMDWVRIGSISHNGFHQQGWIILIPLAFILFTKLTGKLYSRWFNLVLSSIVCLLTIFFLFDKTVYINNEAYNLAALGLHIMVTCTIGYVVLSIRSFIKEKK